VSVPLGENPYKVLGIERDATEAEIKSAYFGLVREHPPERDPEGFKRIRAAYEKLRAGQERVETDLFLIEEPSAPLELASMRRPDMEPSPVTLAMIKADLLALEAVLLFEALSARDA
jgi:curved DNA-binding protein CbpA